MLNKKIIQQIFRMENQKPTTPIKARGRKL